MRSLALAFTQAFGTITQSLSEPYRSASVLSLMMLVPSLITLVALLMMLVTSLMTLYGPPKCLSKPCQSAFLWVLWVAVFSSLHKGRIMRFIAATSLTTLYTVSRLVLSPITLHPQSPTTLVPSYSDAPQIASQRVSQIEGSGSNGMVTGTMKQ